jgi:dihydrofolate synthase/folylpolyglutamate synthase
MLTYQEALDYIYSFVDYGAVRAEKYSPETFSLTRMVDFLAALGNPQTRYPIVHVAGTKGKGSVAAMITSALRTGGYRTGFYTSPHLLDFCERAQVNGAYIPRTAVAEIVDGLRPLVERQPGLTTFELTTALAFQHFAREAVDVAVVEVGLGGRLDATNVVMPRVAVITSLSYDHTYLLGNTLAEIAAEKGGIIKPGIPLVTAPQKPEALAVLERLAEERGAPLTRVGHDWLYRLVSHDLDGQVFEIWSADEQLQLSALRAQGHPVDWRPTRLALPLLGQHQAENGAVAYAALAELRRAGLPLTSGAIAEGLRSVHWPGRFEILSRRPYLVVDGAHNRDSAQKLATALVDYFPGRRVTLVFGASSDKDVPGMLAELLQPASGIRRVMLTQAVHPRAQDPEELADEVRRIGANGTRTRTRAETGYYHAGTGYYSCRDRGTLSPCWDRGLPWIASHPVLPVRRHRAGDIQYAQPPSPYLHRRAGGDNIRQRIPLATAKGYTRVSRARVK